MAVSLLGSTLLCGVVLFAVRRQRLGVARRAVAGAIAGEGYFRNVAEALPGMMWTARPNGALDFANSRWHEYTGLSPEQTHGSGWEKALHPDDLPVTLEKWKQSVLSGEAYEVEHRFRRAADQSYRWFLGQANPIRDEKRRIVKWLGTSTDIEDQKHYQQILEEQIRERTMELADANARLQEQMLQKDQARGELDRQNERMMKELRDRSQRATLLAKMGELLQSCISKDEVYAAATGLWSPDISLHPGIGGAVQCGAKSCGRDWFVGGVPSSRHGFRAQFLLGATNRTSSFCGSRRHDGEMHPCRRRREYLLVCSDSGARRGVGNSAPPNHR